MGIKLNFVPLLVALLPLSAIHLCYLLAAQAGHVPWCVPYLESCTSISATGRQAPESHVFRAIIIPSAAALMVYWSLVHEWVKALNNRGAGLRRTMLVFGVIAALGLIAYVAVLGEMGQEYRLQRRIGVMFFYGFTIIAQLLMTVEVGAVATERPSPSLARAFHALALLSTMTILVGLAGLLLWVFFAGYGRVEDAIEWWVTLFVLLHPLATFFAWRASGYQARFTVSDRYRQE